MDLLSKHYSFRGYKGARTPPSFNFAKQSGVRYTSFSRQSVDTKSQSILHGADARTKDPRCALNHPSIYYSMYKTTKIFHNF